MFFLSQSIADYFVKILSAPASLALFPFLPYLEDKRQVDPCFGQSIKSLFFDGLI